VAVLDSNSYYYHRHAVELGERLYVRPRRLRVFVGEEHEADARVLG